MPAKSKQPVKSKATKPTLEASEQGVFKSISLDLIDDPERPLRTNMTEASVQELVLSIKQVGIIEPIVVKEAKGRYEVIAGHRRTFAARLAKLVEVPCYVRKVNNEESEMLKIHENLYRADISPADEALHFAHLIDKQKLTPTHIAQLISKSQSYVGDRLAILDYPDFLKEAMDKKEISFSVAREFARFDDHTQMRHAVYYAKRGGMTQEMARKWVQDHKRSGEQALIEPEPIATATGESAPVEHQTECVYCREPLRLIDASVVYMHGKCLKEANDQQIDTTPPSPTEPVEPTPPSQ